MLYADICFVFVDDRARGKVFKGIIINIIQRACNIGLHVVNVTSDMGSANRAMWRSFNISWNKEPVSSCPHPVASGRRLHFLADVPHLIKNLKSALVMHNIIFDGELVNVDPIKELVLLDACSRLKLASKLKLEHISSSHFEKMKVSSANQVISNCVASGLRTMVLS